MASAIGVARRLEAANARIDAALAELAPDAVRPPTGRGRAVAELIRTEWLADTLERMAFGEPAGDDPTAALETMKLPELKARAEARGIDPRQKKAELIAALAAAEAAPDAPESAGSDDAPANGETGASGTGDATAVTQAAETGTSGEAEG